MTVCVSMPKILFSSAVYEGQEIERFPNEFPNADSDLKGDYVYHKATVRSTASAWPHVAFWRSKRDDMQLRFKQIWQYTCCPLPAKSHIKTKVHYCPLGIKRCKNSRWASKQGGTLLRYRLFGLTWKTAIHSCLCLGLPWIAKGVCCVSWWNSHLQQKNKKNM